ncbi:MAG TPA: TIGR03546 family protein [Elusimicrobiota bacterium]|nr:TIGR03546 family protein [Elusimicrobiota bacterium]
MNPLGTLKSLLLAFHGGGEPRHLAAGFALGAALGLVPKGNLFAAGFFLLFFLFNVDKGMAAITAAVFTAIAYAIDPVAHALGLFLLKAGALRGLWTVLYGLPIVPWTRFNNTVVLGNLVLGLVFYLPLYYGFLRAQKLYDLRLRARVENLAVVKAINGWDKFQSLRAKYDRWLK